MLPFFLVMTLMSEHGEAVSSPSIEFNIQYYEVAGRSMAEIQHSIAMNAPSKSGGSYYAGVTIWNLNSTYDLIQIPQGCRIDNGQVFLNVVVHLPKISNFNLLSAPVLREWVRFSSALKTHEMLHAQNSYRAASTLLKKISGTKTSVPCVRAKSIVEEATSTLINRISDFDRQLDRETNHGATQGAYLNMNIW